MFRIDAQGAVQGLPPPEPAGQVAGYFSKGNPGLGQKATVVSAEWANVVQEEICNVITGAGLVLDQNAKANLSQLSQAVQSLIGIQVTALPPIGTIIPFYDFNGALTFNNQVWAYCDGSQKTIAGIGPQTLPDLSGRYLVGFGTDGGGDIAGAFAVAPVGNANHTINLSHSHTVNAHSHTVNSHTHTVAAHAHTINAHSHLVDAHTHDLGSHVHAGPVHTHTVPAHFHGKGTLSIGVSGTHSHGVNMYPSGGGGTGIARITNANTAAGVQQLSFSATHSHANSDFSGLVGNTAGQNGDFTFNTGSSGGGSTGQPSTNLSGVTQPGTSAVPLATNATALATDPASPSTNAVSPGTDAQLSAAQSIQPRSIRVRFLMRIS